VSGLPMRTIVCARHPNGRPLSGALVVRGTSTGYPIVHGIPRTTPELAERYAEWLRPLGIEPATRTNRFQELRTVESFAFEWAWDSEPRTDLDLEWRVASRHGLLPEDFRGSLVLDAGCGAGDQSRWLLERGSAARVVSVELSNAVDVAHRKLEHNSQWLGIEGDISALPFEDNLFPFIYCEGVIQHTADSAATVRELLRCLAAGGRLIATHYSVPRSFRGRVQMKVRTLLRRTLSRLSPPALFFCTGCIAALAYFPVCGRLWGRTIAVMNPRMPNFKATWSCTYDAYGYHAFQRHITPEEFASFFCSIPNVRIERQFGTDILATKSAPAVGRECLLRTRIEDGGPQLLDRVCAG